MNNYSFFLHKNKTPRRKIYLFFIFEEIYTMYFRFDSIVTPSEPN